mmetsp:Transcript_19370/g.36580  ORF Transcript_19370/g.36580 Transcript_19370/m.36580 type:complete len:154 (-) Transcript_19370:124-585(-)
MIKALTFLALLAVGTANAWTTPTTSRQEFLQGIVTAAAGAVTVAGAAAVPAPAVAVDLRTQSVFTHEYSDPKHVNCKRVISVRPDGEAALSGTDGNPACPADGSGSVWRLVGDVQGETITVDFSPKGGPSNLKGKWVGDGISWPDGNKWTVKD